MPRIYEVRLAAFPIVDRYELAVLTLVDLGSDAPQALRIVIDQFGPVAELDLNRHEESVCPPRLATSVAFAELEPPLNLTTRKEHG